MLSRLELKNFRPIRYLGCENLGNINLIIGRNGTGKTILLKAIYSAIRTLEAYRRGNEPRSASEILADKLYWTFEVEKIGELVSKGANGPLSFRLSFDAQDFCYEFGKDTTRNIQTLENQVSPRDSNSIFFPTKEVLSLHQIILQSREVSTAFGFDDTYLDLARALRQSPRRRIHSTLQRRSGASSGMTTEPILESGMTFGPYPAGDCFYIEKCKTYQSIQADVKMAEFLLYSARSTPKMWIVEAKSSTPKTTTVPNFDNFIEEIRDKLSNALSLCIATRLKRHSTWSELPIPFSRA